MQQPSDWNTTQRQTQFGFKKLPAGGYVCKIIRVEDTVSQNSGKPMLKIAMDIAEGEFKDYFKGRFDTRLKYNPDAKWPCVGGVMKQNDDGSTHGGFKNFVECVQESTPGWRPAWNENFENKFRGAYVGAVFKEEEFEANDGTLKRNVKPDFGHFKSASDIREGKFEVPEFKPLEGKNGPAGQSQNDYQPQQSGFAENDELPPGFQTIDEDDIPF